MKQAVGRHGSLLLAIAIAIGLSLGATQASAAMRLSSEEVPGLGVRVVATATVNGSNQVALWFAGDSYAISDRSGIDALPFGCEQVSATEARCARSVYDQIQVRTGAGSDLVHTSGTFKTGFRQPFPFPVFLGGGPDGFVGGRGFNYVRGGDGRDLLRGGGRTDFFFGEAGVDHLIGGPARDLLLGGGGRDLLLGGPGRDVLGGGPGGDLLSGGPGVPDFMGGGRGRDGCIGQAHDRIDSCEGVRVVR
jgi:Ca2+-binding RTX toxin-like protein